MRESETPHQSGLRLAELPPADPSRDEDLVGLRREDLDHEERRRLIAALSTSEGTIDREAAMTLALEVGDLPAPRSRLHPGHVLEALEDRRRARRRWRWATGVGVLGFVLTALVLAPRLAGSTTAEWTRPDVDLVAQARTDQLQRPVVPGDTLAEPDTTLHLAVATSGPGALFVTQTWGYGTTRPVGPAERQAVGTGLHSIDVPLTPVRRPLRVRYQAWVCPPGMSRPDRLRCAWDDLTVIWTP
jgi:hypothetical protein